MSHHSLALIPALLLVAASVGLPSAAAAGPDARRLLQMPAMGGGVPAPESEYSALVPAVLEVPAACMPTYQCPGVGPQVYTCNGTSWVNTGSNVSFTCEGGVMGVHSVIDTVPSYNFTCGFAQGRTQGQIMVPNPAGTAADLPIYRREAFNTSGCVAGIKYITRTKTAGGVPTTPTCGTADKGMTSIDYSATFGFWTC